MTYIFGYARVSTQQQDFNSQVELLLPSVGNRDNIFCEKISGRVKTAERPQFKLLLSKLRKNDIVFTTHIDRLGRNATDVLFTMAQIKNIGAELKFLNDRFYHIKDNDPISLVILTIMSAVAEMESQSISRRQKQSIVERKADTSGKYRFGRKPISRAKVGILKKFFRDREKYTLNQIAEYAKCGRATVNREFKKFRENAKNTQ